MNTTWLLAVLGLLVGTYTVRVIPFWFSNADRISPRIQRFLEVVPAAAMGALILPDAFVGISPVIATVVLITSIVLALRGVGITLIVALAIGLAWLGPVVGV